jgi:hypothetical protein
MNMANQTPVVANHTAHKPTNGAPTNGAKPVNGVITAPLTAQARQGQPGQGQPTSPIEPSMWKRYSPHHEFPLSLLATFVLYMFAGLLIAVMTVVGVYWGSGELPEIENIEFAGGGGDPNGSRDSNVNNGPQENIDFNLTDERTDAPVVDVQPDLTAPADATPRLVEEVNKQKFKSNQPNSWGRGGTGTGGGKGSGHGTGEGDGNGPGKQSNREKRKDRWVVNFPFNSGDQYLRHIGDLGAYIAYPDGPDKFRMFEDLGKRPMTGKVGGIADIKKWNRIYWRDSNPDGAQAIAQAMGLPTAPAYFWIFFPRELEDELFKKELAFRQLTEAQIIARNLETVFTVERSGSGYNVRVVKQDTKGRR